MTTKIDKRFNRVDERFDGMETEMHRNSRRLAR
jgi:hypothetical protein